MSNQLSHFYAFGPFRLDSRKRVLLRDGQVVSLAPKAVETLVVLVENAGNLVEKGELMQRVWPDAFVEEVNLAKNIFFLRKLLGAAEGGQEYIETVPKRGYRFVAQVTEVADGPVRVAVPGRPTAQSGADHIQPIERQMSAVAFPETGWAELPPASGSPLARHLEVVHAAPMDPGVIEMSSRSAAEAPARLRLPVPRRWWALALVTVVLLVAAGTYFYIHPRRTPKLTDQDTIVLAEFTNTTGDSVFDGTLRQALSAQLQQSPFLSLVSDARIAQTLTLMGQPKEARLTRELAREVCQRTASAATIEGSIVGLGTQYVLGVQALNCQSGEPLAEERMLANGKGQVLKALGSVATKMRRRLGESLASVEKYDVPLESVTTPSLEALQAYSLGQRAEVVKSDWTAAIPLLQRAVSLDPNFGMAWSSLAVSYQNLGENARAADAMRKAYDLRERVAASERFEIEETYELYVTGDLEAARKVNEANAEGYPRAWVTFVNLGTIYNTLGNQEKSLTAAQQALKLHPGSGTLYANLMIDYLNLNRLDEAKATAREAQVHNLDSPFMHLDLYLIDFLEHDSAGMRREAAGLADKPGYADAMLYEESDSAAYGGQYAQARELTRRAAESAERADQRETAAEYEAEGALREVLVGNLAFARRQAVAALALSDGREVEGMSAVALGLAGESAGATRLAHDLNKQFPKDTLAQFAYLPMIRAAAVIGNRTSSPNATKAIDVLASAYELGIPPMKVNFCPYPVYLRAEAYLAAGQGAAAAAEFQKVLDHPGLVVNQPIGALAHLGLARAYALEAGVSVAAVSPPPHGRQRPPLESGALAKARIAYQDFLALWKDADPDLPILKQAKAEYARLH